MSFGILYNNALVFKTLGTIKYLCLEFVVTLNFLLNLLRKPSWVIYLATVTLDVLLPKKANSAVILGLPYRCFESK
jgi:hypothetical protein